MIVAAVLVAAGSGARLGAEVPKAFCRVGGRTLLEHARARFDAHPEVRDVVRRRPGRPSRRGSSAGRPGRSRCRRGLAALAPDVDRVLVHDVARPFVPADVITRVVARAARRRGRRRPGAAGHRHGQAGDAGRPSCSRRSTARRCARCRRRRASARDVLVRAHASALPGRPAATDDAGLVEALGGRVVAVDGADEAFKITRPWDLRVAEATACDADRHRCRRPSDRGRPGVLAGRAALAGRRRLPRPLRR